MKKPYSEPELTVEFFEDQDIVSWSFGYGDEFEEEDDGSRSASGNDTGE